MTESEAGKAWISSALDASADWSLLGSVGVSDPNVDEGGGSGRGSRESGSRGRVKRIPRNPQIEKRLVLKIAWNSDTHNPHICVLSLFADLMYDELDLIEKDLKENLEKVEAEVKFSQSMVSKGGGNNAEQVDLVDESSRAVKSEELEEKKAELNSFDVMVQRLEEEWSLVQKESMKQPSPETHLSGGTMWVYFIEAWLAQAENLMGEIRTMEKELENLNNIQQKKLDTIFADPNTTRNRFSRVMAGSAAAYADYAEDSYSRPSIAGIRTESLQKLMLLRSAFVLYILALHVIVFIKISF
ncbi:hypothetical protein M5K25_021232 [Dendrobium thyrsiflorum]|uniref:Uncharacterized protein n=1 Tax=Dendrobium thyrsiflorum TaxID=117978 RepID=A0ABD0UC32_DENTH